MDFVVIVVSLWLQLYIPLGSFQHQWLIVSDSSGISFLILNGWKHRKGYWQHIEVRSELFRGLNYMELHSHVCLSVCGTVRIWKSTGCSGWGAVVMGAGVANYSKGISQTLGNQTPNPLCVTTHTHTCKHTPYALPHPFHTEHRNSALHHSGHYQVLSACFHTY